MSTDEVVTARLTGHTAAYAVTRAAREDLHGYLAEARTRLAADPDADEVVRDLESAIGDRLAAEEPAPERPVTRARMAEILAQIGPVAPDAAHAAPGTPQAAAHGTPAAGAAWTAAAPGVAGRPRGRFLCRIKEGQDVAGVCTGLAAYSEIGLDWVRTIVVLLTLFTGGVFGLAYLVAAFVLPVVPTVAEYERRRDAPRP